LVSLILFLFTISLIFYSNLYYFILSLICGFNLFSFSLRYNIIDLRSFYLSSVGIYNYKFCMEQMFHTTFTVYHKFCCVYFYFFISKNFIVFFCVCFLWLFSHFKMLFNFHIFMNFLISLHFWGFYWNLILWSNVFYVLENVLCALEMYILLSVGGVL
jgi:hypothetical protein